MKRNILLLVVSVLVSAFVYGQGEMDAFRLSRNDLTGTARGLGMGGAFGALGGDLTGVASNPGGIAIYRSSEVLTTMNFSSVNIETNTLGSVINNSKFKFNFDNLAYIGYFPIAGSAVKSFNFGIAYNRVKDFDRNYGSKGINLDQSLNDYIASTSNGIPESDLSFSKGGGRDPYRSGAPWLSVLGYQAGMIEPTEKAGVYMGGMSNARTDNSLSVTERGAIESYDITGGLNISDMLFLGLTFSFTDLNYTYNSHYKEDFRDNAGGYDLDNYLDTDGSGYQVSVGAVFRPTDALRLGVAYHSPTWYNMTDYYNGHVITDLAGQRVEDYWAPDNEEFGITSYDFHTPYRWVFSAAGIIGTRAIVSLDYEIADYSGMSLKDEYGSTLEWDPNFYINQHFKVASTLKAGIEVRATPQLSLRAGYAWMQSPLEADFKDGYNVQTVGTIPHFTLEGDAHNVTFGIGYRITRGFYVDAAFMYKMQTDDLYAFSKLLYTDGTVDDSVASEFKNNTYKGVLTLGYKF